MANTKYSIGFDLGGTKVAAALVNSEGEMLEYIRVGLYEKKAKPKSPAQQQRAVLRTMVDCAQTLRSAHPKCFTKRNFVGFGLASAGPLSVADGELLNPHNFDGWKRFKIQEKLAEALAQSDFLGPVYFQNDAMAASLGEGWVGGARNDQSFVVITVGTGVGSGLILNGAPVQTKGMGSEWGHTLIDYSKVPSADQLHFHTVEGIASGTGILRRAKKMGFTGDSTEELVKALRKGEQKWQPLFDEAGRALATLCYILSIGCHLDRILISGGLVQERDLFWNDLKSYYKSLVEAFNPGFKAPIQAAKLKDKAGVIGAARLPFLK